ncbi:MAG: hypothetical protein II208_03430 [Alphaproteobacteria bacterium]|nr:hypothetical protein [Alphaproteobacteria bacterium]
MSKELFNRASKNFDKYLHAFLDRGEVYMLPRERMTDEMWRELNKSLAGQGVRLVPTEQKGVRYMMFSALPKQQAQGKETIAQLRNRASRNFDKYLHAFLERGESYMLPRERLTDEMWRELNKSLAEQGVCLVPTEHNAIKYMMFSPAQKPQMSSRGGTSTDDVLKPILGQYETVSYQGVPAIVCSRAGMGRAAAKSCEEEIKRTGQYYATTLNKEGHSGADYIVIAMKKSDAKKMGAQWDDFFLTRAQDNTAARERLKSLIGKPLTYINGVPVTIESKSDFGAHSDRPIVVVTVGGKRLPFYISTGTAGKTDVPTGKWEFFGGIDSNGWFRKGSLKDIVSHYNSPELKQIADALDKKIGDLRDTEDVLKTIGRKYLGGQGSVARINHAPGIKSSAINRDMFNPQNEGIFALDLRDIKTHLKNLTPQRSKDVAQDLKQGSKSLKDKIRSWVNDFFNDGNDNDGL